MLLLHGRKACRRRLGRCRARASRPLFLFLGAPAQGKGRSVKGWPRSLGELIVCDRWAGYVYSRYKHIQL